MLTILLPVYKYDDELFASIDKIYNNLKEDFEILICFNGPNINDLQKIKDKNDKRFRIVDTLEPGLGAGIRIGAQNTKTDWFLITGHDLPFDFSDYDQWLKYRDEYDIVIGSKNHPDCIIEGVPTKRRILTKIFGLYRRILFLGKMSVDTQGTIFLKSKIGKDAFQDCNRNDFFFTVELVAHSLLRGARLREVPIICRGTKNSSVPLGKTIVIFVICTFLLALSFHWKRYGKK